MQVADACEVFSMLMVMPLTMWSQSTIRTLSCLKLKPSVPNVFIIWKKEDIQVVPSARAVNYTMNRKAIRDLAAKKLD